MTLGPSPGVHEDFGAVRSTPSGDAPDGAAAPDGAKAGRFDDLVEAWLAPAADDDDAEDPAEGVPVAAASPFPITLPLPVIAPPPQAPADATSTIDAARVNDCEAKSASGSQPAIDRAALASPDVVIDPAPKRHDEGEPAQKTAQDGAPLESARLEVANASEAVASTSETGAADEPVRNVRELPGLRTSTPADRPAASESQRNDAIDRPAPAKASPPAASSAPAPPAAESAAAPTSDATVVSASPVVESDSNVPAAASEARAAKSGVADSTTRGEAVRSAAVAQKPGPHEAEPPHKSPHKPKVSQASSDTPRKASVGLSKIDQPIAGSGAPRSAKPLGQQVLEASAVEIDPAGASGGENVAAQDAPSADSPRRSLNLQGPREPAIPPAVEAAVLQATALQAHASAIVPNENSGSHATSNVDDLKATDGARASRPVPAAQPNERSRNETSDERDRDANRDTWRNSADQTQGAARASVPPFVERAESRESTASPSQSARASVTLVHGTAPVFAQATLVQPPTVASSETPAPATPAPDTADRIVQSLKLQVQRGGGDAVLHLQPDHLGPVAISLRVENGSVSAVITAEHPGVAEWLQSNQQSLRDGLQESGLHLERFVVQRDGQSPSDRQRREWAESRRRDFRRRLPQTDSTFEISV